MNFIIGDKVRFDDNYSGAGYGVSSENMKIIRNNVGVVVKVAPLLGILTIQFDGFDGRGASWYRDQGGVRLYNKYIYLADINIIEDII